MKLIYKKALIMVFAIAMILNISFNSFGSFFIFLSERYIIHNEVKQLIKKGLSKDKLTKLTFSINMSGQLKWHKKNKEFSYNNDMYDIVFKTTSADSITYYCYHDKKESILFSNLSDQPKLVTILGEIIAKINIIYLNMTSNQKNIPFLAILFIITYQNNYISIMQDIVKPPPK